MSSSNSLLTKGHLPLLTRLLVLERGWRYGYEPFRRVGADTFMAVSPTKNILYTCDLEVSTQFLHNKIFTKPAGLLQILNIYGPTMTGTDGQETSLYRKTMAPFFNNRTMHQVWNNSIHGAECLLRVVTRHNAPMVEQLRPVLARMTLHILNTTCFEHDQDCMADLEFREQIPEGHYLSYVQAMHSVLDNMANIFLTPALILSELLLSLRTRGQIDSEQMVHHFKRIERRA